jgi:hypothetical protein
LSRAQNDEEVAGLVGLEREPTTNVMGIDLANRDSQVCIRNAISPVRSLRGPAVRQLNWDWACETRTEFPSGGPRIYVNSERIGARAGAYVTDGTARPDPA